MVIECTIVVTTIADFSTNILMIYIGFALDDGDLTFLLTLGIFLFVSHLLQLRYFIRTDAIPNGNKIYPALSLFLLPYLRYYQIHKHTIDHFQSTSTKYEYKIQGASWFCTDYFENRSIVPWLTEMDAKFGMFLYRAFVESFGTLLLLLIYASTAAGNNLEMMNSIENKWSINGVNIIFVSCWIKFINVMIASGFYGIAHPLSVSYDIYSNITLAVAFMADISRYFVTIIIVTYCIICISTGYNGNGNDNDNRVDGFIQQCWNILQVYYYPYCYWTVFIPLNIGYAIWTSCFENFKRNSIIFRLFWGFIVWCFIIPVLISIITPLIQVIFFFIVNGYFISIINEKHVGGMARNIAELSHALGCHTRNRAQLSTLMNRICYFLCSDRDLIDNINNCNGTDSKKRSWMQKIGCINYELLAQCDRNYNQHKDDSFIKFESRQTWSDDVFEQDHIYNHTHDDENPDKDKDKDEDDNINSNGDEQENTEVAIAAEMDDRIRLVAMLDELVQYEHKDLMCNMNDDYYFGTKKKHPYSRQRFFKRLYSQVYKTWWYFMIDFLGRGDENHLPPKVDDKLSFEKILWHCFAVNFIVFMLNLIFFPIYWLVWRVIMIASSTKEGESSNFELFVDIIVCWTIVLYIFLVFLWIKYTLPLYDKLCYVLPRCRVNRNLVYSICNSFQTKRDGEVSDGDKVFESILLHYSSFQLRQIKSKMIVSCNCFGQNIANIILEYLPVKEYLKHHNSPEWWE